MISSCSSRERSRSSTISVSSQSRRWMSFFVRRLRDGFSDSSISCSKLDERAERDQLSMHAYGRAPHAADHLSVDIQLIGQDPLLGMVELIGKTIGKMVE